MKKYLLPLIIILLLTFTLIGNCADLYGTYDQRIKLTVDNTKIDAALTWIPITVLLTSTAGEEVFAEFDLDGDFGKVAFTTNDGSTQLYADCELFDDSAQKAIYHVSKTGWSISDSADTDFYMYYDDDAAHNTTYISKSGDTAAQSVYDGNFKAVYHMRDPETWAEWSAGFDSWTVRYEATAEPDSDGWTLSGTDYASVSAGILTINTSADDTYTCSYYKTPDVNFTNGFYLKTRVKASSDMNAADDRLDFYIKNGTGNTSFRFGIENGAIYYYDNVGSHRTAATTTDDYHVYELYIKATNAKVYRDGVEIISTTVRSEVITDLVEFGDPQPDLMCKAEIDYVYYAIDASFTEISNTTIIDSTSNDNDGTKTGANHPIEATGKVGQGQEYTPTNPDFIEIADSATLDITSEITLECLVNIDDLSTPRRLIDKYYDGSTRAYSLTTDWTTVDEIAFVLGIADGSAATNVQTTDLNIAVDTWYHVAGVLEGNTIKVYKNGVASTDTTVKNDDIGTNNEELRLGVYYNETSNPFDGTMDEVRISSLGRSAAWLKATYNSLYDSLLTYGSEEIAVEINVIFFGTNF